LFRDGNVGAIVELKSETDFVASSERFKQLSQDLAALVALQGEAAVEQRAKEIEDLRITLKEKIEVGDVVRIEAAPGDVLESYLHVQGGRGVNAVLVELEGGTPQLAHDIAVHIAFARPQYLSKDDVPLETVEREAATLRTITLNEGKPESAVDKIVQGRLGGFFKEIALLEQPFAKDDKKTISQVLDGARIVKYAQVEIGR
jgi:elongation factor Ts